MNCYRVSGHLIMACLYWITLASISALPVSKEQHSGPLNSTTQRQSDAPLIGDEVLLYKKKFGCKDLQQSLVDSSVTSDGSLTRRVRLICDGKHVADVLVHVNNSKSVSELVTLKEDDVIEIRDDVTANDNVREKKYESKFKEDNDTVKKDNDTLKEDDINDIDEDIEFLKNKTHLKKRILKLASSACELSKNIAYNLIRMSDPDYNDVFEQKDVSNGPGRQFVEYSVYKPFLDGIYIVTYKISKCSQTIEGVRTTKTEIGQVCNSRAFAVGGSRIVGPIFYGRYPFCLLVSFSNDKTTCFLSNKYVQVIKMDDYVSWIANKVYPIVSFPCQQGMYQYLDHTVAPLLDGFFYITEAQRMLEAWFGYKGLQNTPISVKDHVGTKITHKVSGKKFLIIFGKGRADHTHFGVAPDIVGHQVGHLIIEKDSLLENIPSTDAIIGIIEAFCDMMGKTLEFYIFGTLKWTMGSWTTNLTDGLRPLDIPDTENHVDKVHERGREFTGAVFLRVFYKMAKYFGIRQTMEALLYANSKFWQKAMTKEMIACSIIRAAYHTSLDMFEVTSHFTSVGVSTSRNCPVDAIPLEVLVVGNPYYVTVSKRRRPFFRLLTNKNFKTVWLQTTPRQVTILFTSDRQGRNRLLPDGRGIIKINMSNYEYCGHYIHFRTGVYAEKKIKILTSYE